MTSIDFYFDFISPYAYLASTRIERLAARHGRSVRWHPFRLGVAVVKVMGLRPAMETPLKGRYMLDDVRRLSAVLGEPFCFSSGLPDPLPPARLVYGAPVECIPTLSRALLRAQWGEGQDIGSTAVLLRVAASVGLGPEVVRAALEDSVSAARLREATQMALARGVFGSPTCAVNDALFWGVDRLWLLDSYLESGEHFVPLLPERAGALALS